jgi:hypothetical protein
MNFWPRGAIAFQSQVEHVPRLVGSLIGFAIVILGAALITLSMRLTRGLNVMYAQLPGHFQYPPWFVRAFGGVVCAFGLVILILSLILGQ